jgi:TonB-linked SusC/RagA family outer membrane protein
MGIEKFAANAGAGRLWARSRLGAAVALLAVLPLGLAAQQPAVITGHVTNAAGAPLNGAQVTVPQLGIGATARGDGSYTVLVPAARIPTGPVTVTARLIGYKLGTTQVTLEGGSATADFALADNPLQLGEVVVTGAGTSSEVEKLGTVRNYVDSTAVQRANEQNLVNALAAKAPNVTVTSSSGDPGSSSYIQVRGLTSILSSDGQPLFVIDGVPVDNSTTYQNPSQQPLNSGNYFPPNRLIDLNPDDIENIEILKGASSGAIYGSRAGQGVVLITTKKGRPGQTKYSLRSSWQLDEHTQLPALQSTYGLGTHGVAYTGCVPGADSPAPDPNKLNCFVPGSRRASWGAKLDPSTPVFDHQGEIFQNGYTTDNALTVAGGNDRTQFFLSGGYNYDRGIVIGDNNHFRRISVRFNGSQYITDKLKVGANVAYSNGSGGAISSRNSTAGILLGGWRTPPEFNNLPYLDPVYGLQRSYRWPNPGPGSEQSGRIYDNPFFVASQQPNTSNTGRTFGGINGEWAATSWLKFNEALGLDYSNDERFQGYPWSNSESALPSIVGVGGVSAGYIRNTQVDHNLTATLTYSASSAWKGTITLGQNLNSQTQQQRQTLASGLLAPQPFALSNTAQINKPVFDFQQKIRTESYFVQATADLAEQLYLTAAIRNDGVSSFGEVSRRNWFPKASAAWLFYRGHGENKGLVTYGKLRTAYGQSGTQPTPYLLSQIVLPSLIADGGWGPLTGTQVAGVGGVISGFNFPSNALGPERVKEFEAGVDLGLFSDKADLSVTHYRQNSSDVILNIPVPSSTGYFVEPANAAALQNRGWEVSLNIRPVTTKDFAWDVGLQWARNRGITTALAQGVQFVAFPFSGGGNGAGLHTGGSAMVGQPIGVYLGSDVVRCGRGLTVGVDPIDNTPGECQGAPAGAVYLGADGRPVLDPTASAYVLGDPNPDWTGSVKTNFRFGKLSVGGLLDVRHGGIAYNGTKGALNEFGKNLATAQARDAGTMVTFGQNYEINTIAHDQFAGPGVGVATPLDQSWFQGVASVFNGPDVSFLEDGGFVKIREVSLGYTIDQPWVARSLGFSSIELRVAGRNLVSWNNYSGVDPETSLLGAASPIRGINYFNNPQSRSWVFTLTLNR